MGLEEELQRMLQSKTAVVPEGDPVLAVHAGIRRRVLRQRLAAGGSALSVAAIAVVGTLLLHTTTSDAVPATYAPTSVPAGFQATDLTFLSSTRGYALGQAPCKTGMCTIVLETDDGGQTWGRRHAPAHAAISTDLQRCLAGTCVNHLRFALRKNADGTTTRIGYAYGPKLIMSVDDGYTWQQQPTTTDVQALEASSVNVARVVATTSGGHEIQLAHVGGTDWTSVSTIAAKTRSVQLVRQPKRMALMTYDNNPTESDVSDLRTSEDEGHTWSKPSHLPCDADSTFESMALGNIDQIVVLCTRRHPGALSPSYVRESTDEGRTFGKPHDVAETGQALPTGGRGVHITAPYQGPWLVSTVNGQDGKLLQSRDHGLTWTPIAYSSGDSVGPFLDNSSSRVLTWVGPDTSVLQRSSDSGVTWDNYRFGDD